MHVGAFDNFHGPLTGLGDGLSGLWPLIAGVGEDALDERKGSARLAKNLFDAVAILHVGGMNDNAQQEPKRIDEDVALAPRDLFARIVALRVEQGAPF